MTSTRVFKKHRFIGVSLSGGKSSRTHLAVVDYFPSERKIFLSHLVRDLGEMNNISADTVLLSLIKEHKEDLQSLSFDAPLTTPIGLRRASNIHGIENCKIKEVQWMWQYHKEKNSEKNPNKIFTPYTERCVDQYLSTELEHKFPVDHALGSNRAPIWARAQYLQKQLKNIPLLEVAPRITTWRIGRELKISKTPLLFYKNSVEGAQHRQTILDKFTEAEWLFVYSQDVRHMAKDGYVFDAVMAAFVGFLNYKKLCERPPKGFPAKDGWVAFPKIGFSQNLKA